MICRMGFSWYVCVYVCVCVCVCVCVDIMLRLAKECSNQSRRIEPLADLTLLFSTIAHECAGEQ